MLVEFGKHATLDVRQLVLRHPDYVQWMLEQSQTGGRMALVAAKAREYITAFDSKKFAATCPGTIKGVQCGRVVTRGTAYQSSGGFNGDMYFWCDTCDPYQFHANAVLIEVRKYSDAWRVAKQYGEGKSDCIAIVKSLARAKGMPKRVTESALTSFFGP